MSDPDFPPHTVGEEKHLAAVGRAITDWAYVEGSLYEIVAAILACERGLASIVFYRTPTLDTRLSLASDLVKAIYPPVRPGEHPPADLKTWKKLEADIRRGLGLRNKLAHHTVGTIVEVFESAKDGVIHVGHMARHGSFVSHTERPEKKETSPILGLKDVTDHIEEVSSLIERLERFRDVLAARLAKRA
jgi:hypothetical protein